MNYHKIYTVTAVLFLAVFTGFLCKVCFWPHPYQANAASVQQAVQAAQPSSDDGRMAPVNLAQSQDVADQQVTEVDGMDESSIIQISPDDSQSSYHFASPQASNSGGGSIADDSDSSLLSSSSSSPSSQGGAPAGGGGGSGGSSSPSSQGPVPAGGGGGSGGSGTSGSGTSGSGSLASQDPSPTVSTEELLQCSAGVVPAYQRVLQEEYEIAVESAADIYCAKNETESFQILVCNSSSKAVPNIKITVSQWEPQRSTGRSPVLTLYREHYVEVKKSSYGIQSDLGMYPDALIPFIDPYTNQPITSAKYLANHQSVSPHKSQGYWADVQVGSNVPAGQYTCSILVTSSDRPIAEIPVTLNVWNFTLPARPAWTTWFFSLRHNLNLAYGVSKDTKAYQTIILRHQDFLYEHGIYPAFRNTPQIDLAAGEVIFTPGYISDLKDFTNKYGYRILFIPSIYSDQPELLKKLVTAYNKFSQNNPWAGQYVYYIDEPSTKQDYEMVKQCGDIIRANAPLIKFMVSGDPRKAWDEWPELIENIDTQVLIFMAATQTEINKYQNTNKELWAYTALTQGGPSWLLDTDMVNYRIPAWCSYSLGMEGILYWQTTVWVGERGTQIQFDPWLTQESFVDKMRMWNGEGSLLYPGTQAGIQGPIASMRLKVFRDSVEDYAYFKLLESKVGKTQAKEQVSQLASDFATYETNPELYIAQRKSIAESIVR